MTKPELTEIVDQRMDDPFILGRLACNLRSNDVIVQRHNDARHLSVFWRNAGDYWRCTIFLDDVTELCLAQVDIHDYSTVRLESFEPCSITIEPNDGILCLTRYRPRNLIKKK